MKLKLFLALAMVFSLSACGKDEPEKKEKVVEEQKEEKEEKKSDTSLNDTELLDGTFIIDGVTFTLPMSLQEFEDAGFEIDSRSKGSILPGNTVTMLDVTKDDIKIGVSVSNKEDTPKPIEEATVKSAAFDFSIMKGDCESILFSKDITCKSTSDEVLEAYGEANEKDTGSQNTRLSLSYYGEHSYEEKVVINYYDLESGEISRFAFSNFID